MKFRGFLHLPTVLGERDHEQPSARLRAGCIRDRRHAARRRVRCC